MAQTKRQANKTNRRMKWEDIRPGMHMRILDCRTTGMGLTTKDGDVGVVTALNGVTISIKINDMSYGFHQEWYPDKGEIVLAKIKLKRKQAWPRYWRISPIRYMKAESPECKGFNWYVENSQLWSPTSGKPLIEWLEDTGYANREKKLSELPQEIQDYEEKNKAEEQNNSF